MEAQEYMCHTCKGKFNFESIRYSADGAKIVCKNCYSKTSQTPKKEDHLTVESNVPEAVKIICIKCRYKFTYKKNSRMSLMCPYCGGDNLMKDEITADKLIEEISQSNSY